MLKNERQAGAKVDISTTADILPSASIAQNPMLGEVASRYQEILNIFIDDDRHEFKTPFTIFPE